MANYKTTEAETLSTFQEEIPSIYFSHKGEEDYKSYAKRMENLYRGSFKFPPKMFEGADLIDFGAGTGENTVYLANWGAKCTLVEMNNKAQRISKEVFSKYVKYPENHNFVLSSIFEYSPKEKKQYDIVHCRGVLSHTSEKEEAFKIIASYVKPGGYLIFGDPNKAGGFQNMLQRFAVYYFSSNKDQMVDVSEYLFKEDIDRSEKIVPRTRRAIIFDRWVIQQQDDPSVSEVYNWMRNNGLQIYSIYPPALMPFFNDSYLDNKIDPYNFNELFSISELVWMMRTEEDAIFIPKINNNLKDFSFAFSDLTSSVANLNKNSNINIENFQQQLNSIINKSYINNFLDPVKDKLIIFFKEANEFIHIVNNGNIDDVRKYIENTQHLFNGACGMRHIDFIGYKSIKD